MGRRIVLFLLLGVGLFGAAHLAFTAGLGDQGALARTRLPEGMRRFLLPRPAPMQAEVPHFAVGGLDAGGEEGSTLAVTKPLTHAGKVLGKARLVVAANSAMAIAAQDLHLALERQVRAAKPLAELPDEGMLSFEQVRAAGIGLRYDPASDAIALALP